jgi:hypothetical protein
MSDGGLSFHRVGKGLGAGRWEEGLKSLGNNIKILFQKTCELYFFILSSFGMTCDFQMVGGMQFHA